MVRTQRVAGLLDESVVFSFDWDDATGDVVALRCVNNGSTPVRATITGTGTGSAGRSRSATFQPGTTTIDIPSNQRPRLPVVPDENGVPCLGGYTVGFGGY